MNVTAPLLLATWFVIAAIFAGPAIAAYLWLRSRGDSDERHLIVVPLVFVGLLACVAFAIFFVHPSLGRIFSYTVILCSWIAVVCFGRSPNSRQELSKLRRPFAVLLSCGCLYLALLYTPELPFDAADVSAARFVHQLPPDPVLPALLAEQLYSGERPPPFFGDWLSSDRPPLQSGLFLLALPWTDTFRLPPRLAYQCMGTLAQLL